MADTNVIETHEDAAPESPEHIQEMIDKAERVQSVSRDDGKPSWLPDKFESPEDILKNINKIKAQTIDSDIMPPGNLTGMTENERNKIKLWIELGTNINN